VTSTVRRVGGDKSLQGTAAGNAGIQHRGEVETTLEESEKRLTGRGTNILSGREPERRITVP